MSKAQTSRRTFLKTTVAGTAGAVIASGGSVTSVLGKESKALAVGAGNKWPGRVVVNFNKNVISGTAVDTAILRTMIDDSILFLSNQSTVAAAWKATLPASLSATSKIAIKVPLGCADAYVAPHRESVKAIIDGILAMDFNGSHIPATNITIYEMQCSDNFVARGYKPGRVTLNNLTFNATNNPDTITRGSGNFVNDGFKAGDRLQVTGATNAGNNSVFTITTVTPTIITLSAVDVLTAESAGATVTLAALPFFGNVVVIRDSFGSGYTDGASKLDGTQLQYAQSLRNADFLINVFRAGTHSAGFGGVTLGFKNHYGTYQPDHSQEGHAYLRNLNGTGVVLNKNVLSVCVGLFAANQNTGGPGTGAINYVTYAKKMDPSITATSLNACTIIMSTDPVTAEMQTIKMMRMNINANYAVADMPAYLRESAGIDTGLSGDSVNIGIIDPLQMSVRTIINGNRQTVAILPEGTGRMAAGALVVTRSSKGHVFVEYTVDDGHVGQDVTLEIFNVHGERVALARQKVLGSRNQWSWNETGMNGKPVSAGNYVVSLVVGSIRKTAQLAIQ